MSNQTDGLVLVKFGAKWCAPCRALAPVLDSVLKKFNNIEFKNIDIDLDPTQAAEMNVRSIPTLILFKDGKPAGRLVGNHSSEEIEDFLSK